MSLLFLLLFQAHAADCKDRVFVFNEYEEKVEGRLVTKHSIFEPGEWSRHTDFQGLLVKKTDDADELVFEFRKNAKKKAAKPDLVKNAALQTWSKDTEYKEAQGLEPQKFLSERIGTYTLRLKKGGKVLCESTFAVVGAD